MLKLPFITAKVSPKGAKIVTIPADQMRVDLDKRDLLMMWKKLESRAQPTRADNAASLPCPVCGSSMVYIRGRYPHTDNRRLVCACCAVEKLEQISEIASPEYGKCKQEQQA